MIKKYKDKSWLLEYYVGKKLSTYEIGKMVNIGSEAIRRSLIKFNIPRRNLKFNMLGKKHSEKTKRKMSIAQSGCKNHMYGIKGVNHPTWKGGCRKYYSLLARKIWLNFYGRKIPLGYLIHHMDFNYKNNEPWNLFLVTKGEHNKIHGIHGKRKEI